MLTKKFFCPVNGWDCPYFKEDGSCSMVDDGDDPVLECDDAGYFFGDEEESPFVWEDEDGNRYDVNELLLEGYHFVNGEPVFDNAHAVRVVNNSGVTPLAARAVYIIIFYLTN